MEREGGLGRSEGEPPPTFQLWCSRATDDGRGRWRTGGIGETHGEVDETMGGAQGAWKERTRDVWNGWERNTQQEATYEVPKNHVRPPR